MKNPIIFVCLLFSLFTLAQNLTGEVVYEQLFKMPVSIDEDKESELDKKAISSGLEKEFADALKEQLKKGNQETFTLNFNNQIGLFKLQEKLEDAMPSMGSSGVSIKISRGNENNKLYVDLKNKQYVEAVDFFSKEFVVADQLEPMVWTITNETKQIGNYQSIKAVCVIPVTEAQRKDYEEALEKNKDQKTNFFGIKEPKDREIIAWFTPQIPVGHAPDKYHGLPGLILEIKDENLVYLASKITLNPKNHKDIKLPNTKKAMNKNEFEQMREKKIKSMKGGGGDVIISPIIYHD